MMTVSLGPTPRENILAWDHILQTNTQTHLEKRNQRNLKGMCSCLLLSHSLPLPLPLPLLLSHSFCTLTCTHTHILTHTDAHTPQMRRVWTEIVLCVWMAMPNHGPWRTAVA